MFKNEGVMAKMGQKIILELSGRNKKPVIWGDLSYEPISVQIELQMAEMHFCLTQRSAPGSAPDFFHVSGGLTKLM